MSPSKLPRLAEALGGDELERRAMLVEMVTHESAAVREGAVLGLARMGLTELTRILLKERLEEDPSPAVRAAILDTLAED
jgi:HEAT repeat protein